MRIIAVRHFETGKNVLGIHGTSNLAELSRNGLKQADRTARRLRRLLPVAGVVAFDTPQARGSAAVLAKSLAIPYEGELALAPYDLGAASGVSHDELRVSHPKAAQLLDLFRTRAIDVSRLDLPAAEDQGGLERRLVRWWKIEGSTACRERIVVGSNSTLLMLTNLLGNQLPSSGKYMFYGIPGGGIRAWTSERAGSYTTPQLALSTWPEIVSERLDTPDGWVMTSRATPGWDVRDVKCVIAPGYFGNTRSGPYGLYTRLARALAFEGFETTCLDYLGSGESAPVARSFRRDVASIRAVVEDLAPRSAGGIIVIGHSLGCSAAAACASELASVTTIALAPLSTLTSLARAFLSEDETQLLRESGKVVRKGVAVERTYIDEAERSWRLFGGHVSGVVIAEDDQYDLDRGWRTSVPTAEIIGVSGADHNFAPGRSSELLISAVVEQVQNWSLCRSEQ